MSDQAPTAARQTANALFEAYNVARAVQRRSNSEAVAAATEEIIIEILRLADPFERQARREEQPHD